MTLQELSQLIKMRERLDKGREVLESLQTAACPGAQVLSGMPHMPGVKDKVGDLAVEIADMKERIRYLETEITTKEAEIVEFIKTIEDEQLRVLFRLRFVRCLTWQQAADIMGIESGEERARKMASRYLDRL